MASLSVKSGWAPDRDDFPRHGPESSIWLKLCLHTRSTDRMHVKVVARVATANRAARSDVNAK